VRRQPIAALYAVALAPNAVASLLNIAYNQSAIVGPLQDPDVQGDFRRLQLILNSVFFPVGMALFGVAMAPVVAGLRRQQCGELLSADDRLRRRLRGLRLGE